MKNLLRLGLLLSVALLAFSITSRVKADEPGFLVNDSIPVGEDVYLSKGSPSTNQNNGLLFASFGTSTDDVILLKFDVSGIGYAVDKARVALALVDNPGAPCFIAGGDSTKISLYQTTDLWAEGTVTTNSAPVKGAPIATTHVVDATTGHIGYEDTGAGSLASYVEAERGGDGVVSIWAEITNGALGDQVVFADKENAGLCVTPLLGDAAAALGVADATGPLAVSLSETGTNNLPSTTLFWGALTLLVVTLGGLVVMRKRDSEVSEI
jgi:hypothetical protein